MKPTTTTINRKKYTVHHVFSMVGNWYFTDTKHFNHLVDAEDVQEWAQEQGLTMDGVNTAITYAKAHAPIFWWKVK